MSVASRVRVAVWGLGPHARNKIVPAIAECRATTLAGVTTRKRDVGEASAAQFNTRYFETPEEMLASPEVDVVYLSTPIGLHSAQGLDVLSAGKHLWCEKSLTSSADATRLLASQAGARGLGLCEAFMYLYHQQWRALQRLVTDEVGTLHSIAARFTMPWPKEPGFRRSPELGGGALLDVGCYPVSLALALGAGEPNVLTASVRFDDGGVDVDGHATLLFPSGTLAQLEWGFGRAYLNDLSISGERVSLAADRVFSKSGPQPPTIVVGDMHGNRRSESIEQGNAFVSMLEAFAASVGDQPTMARLRAEAVRQAATLERIALTR